MKVNEIIIGQHHIQLQLDGDSPQVIVGSKAFDKLDDLARGLFDFSQDKYALEIAQIANFMFTGVQYEVIDDVAHFRSTYTRRLKENEDLQNYGEFDTTLIKKPYVENGCLIFFVEERATGLPFLVEGPFPLKEGAIPFTYLTLPYC